MARKEDRNTQTGGRSGRSKGADAILILDRLPTTTSFLKRKTAKWKKEDPDWIKDLPRWEDFPIVEDFPELSDSLSDRRNQMDKQ